MKFRRIFGGCFLLALVASVAGASTRLLPVASGTAGERAFRTTVELRNRTTASAECRFEYRSLQAPDAPLVAAEQVAPGESKVIEGFLSELTVATTVRVTCTGDVDIFSRIQKSNDAGRLFRAFEPSEIAPGETRTLDTTANLLLAETQGKASTVEVTLTGQTSGRSTTARYELLPFGQRVLDVARAVTTHGPLRVDVTSAGAGRVVVTQEARGAELADVARPQQTRRVTSNGVEAPPSPNLLLSSFKAAPLRDPATGLVQMRHRWYEPGSGTFLSPDPEGYTDSSNPYAYCGGDPVNCSDPTGRMGDGGDLREHFRRKEQEEAARKHAIWCAQNPVECRKVDVRGRAILRILGGAGQTVAGTGAVLSTGPIPEPVTKGLGGTAIVRGIDNTATGAVELWTGTERDTVTGRGLYLFLVKCGVSPAKASKITGWTEVTVDVVSSVGSSVVPAVNTALRLRPIAGVVNIGGTGEVANVSNLNPVLANTGGRTVGIPNHVRGYGEQIAELFAPNSARQIMSNRLPFNTVNWEKLARGSYTVLQKEGEVGLNIYVTGLSRAEEAAFQARVIQAFQQAGFKSVRVQSSGPGTMLWATK